MTSAWMVPCFYCDGPVDAYDRYTYQRIEGWHRKGNHGGSDISNRELIEGVFAHPRCVDRAKTGVNVGQESLV